MEFRSQVESLHILKKLADTSRQSVLIEGPSGCGKTFLAKQYANMNNVEDFVVVPPKVSEIREAVDRCSSMDNRVLICIENLDEGVKGASYTILKSLEEPSPNVFIVITCRNIEGVPDTIISRSSVVTVSPPTSNDLVAYAESRDFAKYHSVKDSKVCRCARSFADIDSILSMDANKIEFYEKVSSAASFKDCVSTIAWNISHYENSKDEPNLDIVVRCIADSIGTKFATKCALTCIDDLHSKSLSKNAVLARFVMNIKYCE